MNLLELQKILGEAVKEITKKEKTEEEHKKDLENAEYIAKISKQMINNADVILRSEKLIAEGRKLPNTERLIGK